MGKKAKAKAPATAPAEKPVDQRGKEWQAERLTGARAQRGIDTPHAVRRTPCPHAPRTLRQTLTLAGIE